DVEGAGGEHRAGGAGGDDRARAPVGDRAGGLDDRRLGPAPDGADRLLLVGDPLRRIGDVRTVPELGRGAVQGHVDAGTPGTCCDRGRPSVRAVRVDRDHGARLVVVVIVLVRA